MGLLSCFFFFQAEDGIRDVAVTGVQTCALPIFALDQVLFLPDVRDDVVELETAVFEEFEELVVAGADDADGGGAPVRSEEHTSELQSRLHLVCRLLLEKKKKKK